MDYRFGKPKPPVKRRTVQKTNTPSSIYATNGETFSIAYPCFYTEIESPKILKSAEAIKELGRHPDIYATDKHFHKYHDYKRDTPIHLREEYDNPQIEVSLEKPDVGISLIDAFVQEQPYDYIIRLLFDVNCEMAQTDKLTTLFTIRLVCGRIRSVVNIGRLVVLPAIL